MVHGDSSTGTPVTLVVPPGSTTAPPPPDRPLPHTGFGLLPVLLLAAVLVAVGTVLLTAVRRRAHSPR